MQRDETPPDPQLQLLLSIADLLAACAEGKHLFIESVCQNIFSIKEIVKWVKREREGYEGKGPVFQWQLWILNYSYLRQTMGRDAWIWTIINTLFFSIVSLPLPPLRKKPFVRFLISVYMSSDRDQEDRSGSGVTLSHGKYDHSLTPFSPHSFIIVTYGPTLVMWLICLRILLGPFFFSTLKRTRRGADSNLRQRKEFDHLLKWSFLQSRKSFQALQVNLSIIMM